jgi:signal transduction histidine kinase
MASRIPAVLGDRSWVRYSSALLACLLALLVGWVFKPLKEDGLVFVALFPAVAFAGLYCGMIPSVLAVILSAAVTHWFMPKIHSFGINASQLSGMLWFLVASSVIVTMGEARHRSHEAMRKAQVELEEQVRQRTRELDAANSSLHQLSARLLQLQDEERRRFARELHDSVGQTLAALSMNLSAVRIDVDRMIKTSSTLSDSEALVQEMSKEIRTISHLLHPPLLDETGLSAALRWYVDGFAQRSNINVDLDISEDFGRLPQELEIAIFRTVQECLTNIHRHSESPVARISIARSNEYVHVEVEDTGKGISQAKQNELASTGIPGVGIRGMRERLKQLGGSLEISASTRGTVVVAQVPVSTASVAAA